MTNNSISELNNENVKQIIDALSSDLLESEQIEIYNLIIDPEFLDFAQSVKNELDDGITFDDLLSSKSILKKALQILEKQKALFNSNK